MGCRMETTQAGKVTLCRFHLGPNLGPWRPTWDFSTISSVVEGGNPRGTQTVGSAFGQSGRRDVLRRFAARGFSGNFPATGTHVPFAPENCHSYINPAGSSRLPETEKAPSIEDLTRPSQSGRRDLNPRLRPWEGRTLPLSYSRVALSEQRRARWFSTSPGFVCQDFCTGTLAVEKPRAG